MSVTSWFLVSSGGTRHRLPREMIFVGRDDCELMLQSRSVDKQHAVINYEVGADEHKVKDLGSLNGTFVNDVRIQEQMYITLKLEDKLRFGYDILPLRTWLRGELTVPEEALKSPNKTSTKAAKSPGGGSLRQGESRPAEKVTSVTESADMAALHRGTPLYGQPSWWGDGDADDENSFKQETKNISKKPEGSTSDSREVRRGVKVQADGLQDPCRPENPTKEGQLADNGIHEIPTKDTEGSNSSAQGHASFTIEFDSPSPGKGTIKDHVSRFAADHPTPRPRGKKSGSGGGVGGGGRDLSTLQVAMMASESKVADWLAQNDPTLVRGESTEEDSKSIKSDVPVHLSRLKGSKHEDGTQSDSENGVGIRFANRRHALEDRLRAAGGARTPGGRTSFMIEFYDEENPRKRRSYSFSQSAPLLPGGVAGEGLCPQPPSHPKVFSISTSATINSCGDSGKGPAPIPATVTAGAPTAARVLLKQRSEDPSIGRSSVSTGLRTGSPTSPSEEASAPGREAGTQGGAEDDQSDKGTYTIELENRNPEEEEARRMIDKVFGVDQHQNPDSSVVSDLKAGGGKEIGDPGKEALIGDSSWVSKWASSVAANQTRTDPEGSGAETPAFLHKEREASGKRRTLPLLPLDETRAKSGTKAPGLRSEIGEKQDTELQEKESHMEHKGDGQSNTPLEEGEMVGKRKPNSTTSSPSKPALLRAAAEPRKRFTVEKPSGSVPTELIPRINRGGASRGAGGARERSDSAGSMDTATLLKDTEAVMAFLEAKLRDENKLDHKGGKTKAFQASRTGSISPESDVDTASTSQATGEAERRALAAGGSAQKQRRSLSSMHREKSNASASSKTAAASARERLERKTKSRTSEAHGDARHRPAPPAGSSRARQPSLDLTDDDQTSFPISDILSSDQESYSAPGFGGQHYRRRGSHLSADDLIRPKTETAKGSGRTLQTATASSLGKQAGVLPQPRPTRASLLRRARLGDASDTDLADADRVSVASEVSTTSSTSKPPSGRKGPSRLDMLAQPRKNRVGSFSARSDSECTAAPPRSSASSTTGSATGRLSAETALRLGLRSSTPTESRLTPRMRANSVSKLTETRSKTQATSGYCSPTDSPQPEPEGGATEETEMEYGSTSEEEFGSNRSSNPKHGGRPHLRPHHHPVLHRGSASRLSSSAGSTPTTAVTATIGSSGLVSGPGLGVMKHRMREQDEYIRDWTAHSEEIARISQDLAKDLAILAREIHDVAGEIDS
ncbi:hypothetical protein NHX12_023012, partial [Muraenolepis orangiensis]